ncbi:LuxR C-terminal-related transcriptional regulator [Prevotella melaninogenica]|jgi:bacterial regulatory proteins, luxR family|uniref:LuxR C-terminal-related transcriptional regulator n=1 Tax=Prevotella melaninogenica TaxID=28132 RepID=UPI001C5D5A5C|nr:LuxR C-terminal-related transcriptional regulator [Prevotella melaninogenica]MBW4736246.1 LuxR C-terminal-related transcriptional regulator [Prevotella melaninogenica]MBW4879091.1 LuxR C-terminal-related transcriptional regulator [Prevotella melaninogenica]
MRSELSPTEFHIAESYCRGLIDKEVAEVVDKPIWTVRTHKKHIYQKLQISSMQELVLWMVCKRIGKVWNAREVRLRGLSAILSILLFIQAVLHIQLQSVVERRRIFPVERIREEIERPRNGNGNKSN